MSKQIYRPPTAAPQPPSPMDRKQGRGLAIAGCVLLLAPLFGMFGTVAAMVKAFDRLAASGQADAEALAGDLSSSLVSMIIGAVVGLLGGLLCALALFGEGNRELWFLRVGTGLSILNIILFPVGTVIGIALIAGFVAKWKEFTQPLADHV